MLSLKVHIQYSNLIPRLGGEVSVWPNLEEGLDFPGDKQLFALGKLFSRYFSPCWLQYPSPTEIGYYIGSPELTRVPSHRITEGEIVSLTKSTCYCALTEEVLYQ